MVIRRSRCILNDYVIEAFQLQRHHTVDETINYYLYGYIYLFILKQTTLKLYNVYFISRLQYKQYDNGFN